ncbi:hypothetical protein FBR05_05340 [Deltaproteobacteria bacterium PRO3]|nr:hypothetical protein [Deltaproteobacteria bacterium PRO3]
MASAPGRALFGFLILVSFALTPHLKAEPCTFPSQKAVYLFRPALEYQSSFDEEDLFVPDELKDAFWKQCVPGPHFALAKSGPYCRQAFGECQDWTIARAMLQAMTECIPLTKCDDYTGNPPLAGVYVCSYAEAQAILTQDLLAAKPALAAKVQQACYPRVNIGDQDKAPGTFKAVDPGLLPKSRGD